MRTNPQSRRPLPANRVREIREAMLMSKAELARRAGVSPLTIDRIERGYGCRMETKRKIILALGYDLKDRNRVFFDLGNETMAADERER